jgi:hypothetical protein
MAFNIKRQSVPPRHEASHSPSTKAPPPRPEALESAPPREEEVPSSAARSAKEYWKRIDDLFYETINHAERAFDINVKINIIVVGVGISLLAYSIIYSALNSLDIFSTAFGSLGVASFIALFYFTPQNKIQKTVGDLVQIQMIYRTFTMQAEAINDYAYSIRKTKDFDLIKNMNEHFLEQTQKVIDKIEKCIGEQTEDK